MTMRNTAAKKSGKIYKITVVSDGSVSGVPDDIVVVVREADVVVVVVEQ